MKVGIDDQERLHHRRCRQVLDVVASVAQEALPNGSLSRSVDELLAGVSDVYAASAPTNVVAVHVPLSFAGAEAPSAALIDVAAACTALHIGARLLDDLMDGHELSYLAAPRSSSDPLGWATFLSVLPPLILSRVDLAHERRVAIVDRFALGMAEMAAGQVADNDRTAVEGKSGALLQTFAGCAARAVGLDDVAVGAAERAGRSLGIGRQLVDDTAKSMRDDSLNETPSSLIDRALEAELALSAALAAAAQLPPAIEGRLRLFIDAVSTTGD